MPITGSNTTKSVNAIIRLDFALTTKVANAADSATISLMQLSRQSVPNVPEQHLAIVVMAVLTALPFQMVWLEQEPLPVPAVQAIDLLQL